jgi:hypothetical protein
MREMMTQYYHKKTSSMAVALLKAWNETHAEYQLDKAALDRHFTVYADRIRQTLTLAPHQAEINAVRHRLTDNANPIGEVPQIHPTTRDQLLLEPVQRTVQRPTPCPPKVAKAHRHNRCRLCGYCQWTPWHQGVGAKECSLDKLQLEKGLNHTTVLDVYFTTHLKHWAELSRYKRRTVAKNLQELNLLSRYKRFFKSRSLNSLR